MVGAELVLSAISLGIQVTDNAITALKFVHDVIVDVRQYGDQVTTVRTRIQYETARIQYFTQFLKRKTQDGKPHLSTFHESSQSAVFGLIQELETTFAAYIAYVNKHDIQSLRQGYVKSQEKGLDGSLVLNRLGEAQRITLTIDNWKKLQWGIFEKRRIMKMLNSLEDWSEKTMKLLLCSISFSPTANKNIEATSASPTS